MRRASARPRRAEPWLGSAGLGDRGFVHPQINRAAERARAIVEHVIGHVKNRFTVLQTLGNHDVLTHGAIFFLCCALYNRQLRLYGPDRGM